jgi:cell division protein FtsL
MDKSLRIKIAHALRALDSERTELARERDSLQDELSKFAAAKESTFKL